MQYISNIWYVAAWSDDLVPGGLLARTILDTPAVLFRTPDGSVAALQDRCSHRFAPLHMGTLHDGVLQCAYHGLRYDRTGRCVHNPQGVPPRSAVVRSYPVAERDGIVWIWFGRPELSDTGLLPDYSFLAAAKPTARFRGYIASASHYELMVDNIMDLSHIDYLHPTSLGSGSIARVTPEVTPDGDSVHIRWTSNGQKAAPIYDPFLPEPGGLVDQVIEVTWRPPGLMFLRNVMRPVGYGSDRDLVSSNVHLITPETDRSSHYYFSGTRNFNEDDAVANERRQAAIKAAFVNEDKPMVEAVQHVMGDETDVLTMHPVLLASDAGAVRARRIVRRLIDAERSAVAAIA